MEFKHNGRLYRVESYLLRDLGIIRDVVTGQHVAGWSFDERLGAHVIAADGGREERDKTIVEAARRLLD